MLRKLRWFFGTAVMVVTILPCRLATSLGYRDGAIRWWCRLGLWSLGVTVRAVGGVRENARGSGALIVANHTSYMDVLALGACAPGAFLAKGEIARWPIMGSAAKAGGVLFVDRKSKRASHRMLELIGRAMTRGELVLIFPEGGILSNGGEPGKPAPFRPMFFQASVDTGCPVVPVGIKHLKPDDPKVWAWEEGVGIYEHMVTRVLAADVVEVEVRFAQPLFAGEGEGRKELARRAHEEVTRLIA